MKMRNGEFTTITTHNNILYDTVVETLKISWLFGIINIIIFDSSHTSIGIEQNRFKTRRIQLCFFGKTVLYIPGRPDTKLMTTNGKIITMDK